jgi:hypothetical protein
LSGKLDTVDLEIRDHIQRYLAGEESLDAFEEWFVSETWDDRTTLAATVDHLLAERDVLGAGAFDEGLRVTIATVELGDHDLVLVTGSMSETLEAPLRLTSGNETIRWSLGALSPAGI